MGDEFVFQAVIDEILGVNALDVDEAPHLVDHAFVQAGTQAAADALAAGVTIDLDTDDQCVLHGVRLGEGLELGVQLIVAADLDGTCGARHGVDVAVVAQGLHGLEQGGQFLERLACQLGAQFLVAGDGWQLDALDDGLDIHARAAAHDHWLAAPTDVVIGPLKVLQELIQAVAVARRADVDKVIGHVVIFGQVLARADVHTTINLT